MVGAIGVVLDVGEASGKTDYAFGDNSTFDWGLRDADGYTFMDNEDFAQFTLTADQLEDQLPYLHDGIEGLYGLLVEGNLVGIELPAVVEMAIEETPPAIKGSSASARTKTARFATGLEIQIPEYLETGEVLRINTVSGKFMSRA